MKKVTLSTIKSFIRKNRSELYIDVRSKFDGMTDGCEKQNGGFVLAGEATDNMEHRLGIKGAWFVKDSRDYFTAYDKDGFIGYEVSNCCGFFIIAVKSEERKAEDAINAKHTESADQAKKEQAYQAKKSELEHSRIKHQSDVLDMVFELGQEAKKAGAQRVPVLDKRLIDTIAKEQDNVDTLLVIDTWLDGYDYAKVIPELSACVYNIPNFSN